MILFYELLIIAQDGESYILDDTKMKTEQARHRVNPMAHWLIHVLCYSKLVFRQVSKCYINWDQTFKYHNIFKNLIIMLQRKAWTLEEDTALKELHETRRIAKWAQISRLMEKQFALCGRSGKQCRQRYNNHLDQSIKHQKWTSQEETILINLHNSLGNRWAEIARAIAGRSENCVKNQLYSIMRRGLRYINSVIRNKLKRYKQLEIQVIYKIIQACQSNFKRKTWTKQMNQNMNIKKQIVFYAMQEVSSGDDEQVLQIKQLTERIKTFLKNNRQNLEKEDASKSSQPIEQEEQKDKFVEVVLPKEVKKERKNSFLTFRLQGQDELPTQEKIEEKTTTQLPCIKKQSFVSNHSLNVNSPRFFDLLSPNSTLKSLECPEFTRNTSPKPLISIESPYFDQLRGNLSNWYSFYPK